jgi:hypothetical protein
MYMAPWLGNPHGSHIEEFSQVPFAAGQLVGLRAWRVTDGHMLRPSSVAEYTWTPGENLAQCIPGSRPVPEDHQLVGGNCMCGFYAYHDGTNTYAGTVTISGIMMGYGRCVHGTKGFRAEKARILAIVKPSAPQRVSFGYSSKNDIPMLDFDLLASNYPAVPVFESVDAALDAFPLTPKQVTN